MTWLEHLAPISSCRLESDARDMLQQFEEFEREKEQMLDGSYEPFLSLFDMM